jgi:hypothetical protein
MLREVRLGIAQWFNDTILGVSCFSDTMEEFATRSCWDSDIHSFAKYCKNLRLADICGSACVSDRVSDNISIFEQPEELNLCKISSLSEDAL